MVADLLDAIVSWRTFLIALLVFGFAPGILLRVIILAFRRDDPRRSELLAELYAVPRLERPFWVVEQLEVALFEGIRERLAAIFRRTTPKVTDVAPLSPEKRKFAIAPIDYSSDRFRFLQIADQIRLAIQEGQLAPGEQLPSEATLCELLGVSRGTVREALFRLRNDALIVSVHGRGWFVRSATARRRG
jgi:hypothetical protein